MNLMNNNLKPPTTSDIATSWCNRKANIILHMSTSASVLQVELTKLMLTNQHLFMYVLGFWGAFSVEVPSSRWCENIAHILANRHFLYS